MGQVRRRRRQERERRSGRTFMTSAANRTSSGDPESVEAYRVLEAHLAQLRSDLGHTDSHLRPVAEVQRDRADLERSIGQAIACAFAADFHGSLPPQGVTSWAAEGLARSYERELLMLASPVDAVCQRRPLDLPYPRLHA